MDVRHYSIGFVGNRKFLMMAAVIFLLLAGLITCNNNVSSTAQFTVISAGGTCEGLYKQDSDATIGFTVNQKLNGSTFYYSYTKDLISPQSVTISVDAKSCDTSSIRISIINSDITVKEVTFTPTVVTNGGVTSCTISGDLTYTFSTTTTTGTGTTKSASSTSGSATMESSTPGSSNTEPSDQ